METLQNDNRIKSIDKAVKVLNLLSSNKQEVGISEMSETLKMSLATVHRIVSTLKYHNYVIQNQKTKRYRLGIKLFELGCHVQNSKNIIKIVKPFLKELSQATQETANLAILEGKYVIYLDTIESLKTLRTGINPGTKTLAHCTALGKCILAFLPENDFEQLYGDNECLPSLTPQSISTLTALKIELKKVREKRYALDKEESLKGINCIGVPILNELSEPIAAISITGPASRFFSSKIEDAKDRLLAASKNIYKYF